jgi:hypothetical protein
MFPEFLLAVLKKKNSEEDGKERPRTEAKKGRLVKKVMLSNAATAATIFSFVLLLCTGKRFFNR